jgi:hypothetical protein
MHLRPCLRLCAVCVLLYVYSTNLTVFYRLPLLLYAACAAAAAAAATAAAAAATAAAAAATAATAATAAAAAATAAAASHGSHLTESVSELSVLFAQTRHCSKLRVVCCSHQLKRYRLCSCQKSSPLCCAVNKCSTYAQIHVIKAHNSTAKPCNALACVHKEASRHK